MKFFDDLFLLWAMSEGQKELDEKDKDEDLSLDDLLLLDEIFDDDL